MNFIANEGTQALVNKLVPRDLALVLELFGDHQGLKMRVVVAEYLHQGIVESGLDQSANFRWVHFVSMLR